VLPDVITGDAEARLSFTGALSRVRPEGEPVLVMDIGGGSTEFIVGSSAGEMESAISLDIGSVRLTERFLKVNPPAEDDLARAADYVDQMLEGSGVDLELEHYDRDRVHGSSIPRHDVDGLLRRLSGMTVAEIRSLPSMHPDRADVITGGTLVAARVAERLGVAHMLISESDILDGVALAMLDR
jgi:exopolyphosphatase/guanosine-5'-triphosphate,3'-diphosphate pyrophosphatase